MKLISKAGLSALVIAGIATLINVGQNCDGFEFELKEENYCISEEKKSESKVEFLKDLRENKNREFDYEYQVAISEDDLNHFENIKSELNTKIKDKDIHPVHTKLHKKMMVDSEDHFKEVEKYFKNNVITVNDLYLYSAYLTVKKARNKIKILNKPIDILTLLTN